MKVVFPRMETFHYHGAYDGGSKFIQLLAEELVRVGIQVEIVTTQLRVDPLLKSDIFNGVKYTFIKPFYTGKRLLPGNMFYKLVFSKNLNKYLKSIDFDILHGTEAFSYYYLHNKLRRSTIFQCWALEPWSDKTKNQKLINKLYTLLLRHYWGYCIRNSDSIAADDEFQLPRILPLGIDKSKVWYIPNGVAYRQIQEQKKRFVNKRKELGFLKRDFIILSVCQIAPAKGIDDIINGFIILKKKIPNAKLIMIGKGILEPMLHNMIKKFKLSKDVIHLKNIPDNDLFNYHFSSDLFVSAVLSDDFMISIQEGMAVGLPIVSSSQPFLVKNGVNGYVVGFNNPGGIAEAIIKIYESSRRYKMGKVSKKMARLYDYDKLAQLALAEYKKLLNHEVISIIRK